MPKAFSFISETWKEFSQDDCFTLSAALAYYTVFSLPAALLIVVRVAGAVFGHAAVQGQLQSQLSSSMGPDVANEIGTMISHAASSTTGGTIALALGIAGLVWSASNVTSQLQTALNRTWDVRPKDEGISGTLIKRLLSFLLIGGIGVLVLLALVASASVVAFSRALGIPGPLLWAGEGLLSFVIFVFLFGAVYKVLPDARLEWSDVRAGAIMTAVLFVAGKLLIGVYIGHTSLGSGYGLAGSLALLLLWTYYSSAIFLMGAEFTQVWSRRHGKWIMPDEHAVRVPYSEQSPRSAA